jgi:RNA polymerase sigma-70 factor (ECF subfamily)
MALQRKVEPDDIVQEVAIDAVRRVAELKTLERDLFGWLCQIAEYRLVDAHRRFFDAEKRAANREVAIDAPATQSRAVIDFLVASMTTPSQAFSRNEREIALYAALEELPPESRDALRMRYVEGLASKEIAERLGKSDGAIRVLLTRSVQKLQQIMEQGK